MLINFSNLGLSEIQSESPSSDNHPIVNLISSDVSVRHQGFLADCFVKPPVLIKFNFHCEINLTKILVNCVVGRQKSVVVQIFTEQLNNPGLKNVGFCSINQDQDGILFYRHGTIPECRSPKYKLDTFNYNKSLYNVKSVYLKILRTENSTVPALGGVDVWGEISRNNSKGVSRRVQKIWNDLNHRHVDTDNSQVPTLEKPSICSDTSEMSIADNEIPKEFLDPITFEILTIPMILPCGQTVDITTLEKFYKMEEGFGRGQSDPFTGVPFTSSIKPVVDVILKTRLDKFLLDNCNLPALKNVPRTVGRKAAVQDMSMLSTYAPSSSSCSSLSSATKKASTSEKRKKWDVDSLLESSLAGLPSFLEKPVSKKFKVECTKCCIEISLYKLLCNHLLCRSCLLTIRNSKSKCICGEEINFHKVEKYHGDTN